MGEFFIHVFLPVQLLKLVNYCKDLVCSDSLWIVVSNLLLYLKVFKRKNTFHCHNPHIHSGQMFVKQRYLDLEVFGDAGASALSTLLCGVLLVEVTGKRRANTSSCQKMMGGPTLSLKGESF